MTPTEQSEVDARLFGLDTKRARGRFLAPREFRLLAGSYIHIQLGSYGLFIARATGAMAAIGCPDNEYILIAFGRLLWRIDS